MSSSLRASSASCEEAPRTANCAAGCVCVRRNARGGSQLPAGQVAEAGRRPRSPAAARDIAQQMAAMHRVAPGLDGHDQRMHRARYRGEPDQRDMRQRVACRRDQEHAQRGVDPDDHHEIVRGGRGALVPCPAPGPDHGSGQTRQNTAPKATSRICNRR